MTESKPTDPENGSAESKEEFGSVSEFWKEIDVIDNNILKLEKEMGAPINFFDAGTLSLLLKKIAEMRDENVQAFTQEMQKVPESGSSAAFWATRSTSDDDLLNWPAKVKFHSIFPCRLIGRLFINQIKMSGIEIDQHIEDIILKALPFQSLDFMGTWKEKVSLISEAIESEQVKSLEECYKLPQSEEIAKVAILVSQKLDQIDVFRIPDEILPESYKSQPQMLGDDVKQVVQRFAGRGNLLNNFFGHVFPKAIDCLRDFCKKPESK